MPFGLFGERMPYTNFHRLNLDWIIKEVKELGTDVADYKEQLDAMGVSIEEFREYIDNLDEEIDQKIAVEVPQQIQHEIQTGGFNALLSESHKRRVVCIGDSYGEGWTPDGTFPSWISKLKIFLGVENNDFAYAAAGGAGFGKPASQAAQYIPTLINRAYDNIANAETVTDVIFGLGYNDYLYADEPTTIKNGINTAVSVCKQRFPNARIHIFAMGFTTNHATQWALNKTYQAYATTLNDFQFYNISDALSETVLFSTDGIHPLENGQQNIALRIARQLNNYSDFYNYINDIPASNITWEMLIGDTQDITGLFQYARSENSLYLSNTGVFKLVSLGNTTANIAGASMTKIAKLKNAPITGYFYHRNYITTQAVMYYSVSGDNTLKSIPVDITLAQDNANSDVYLWIETKDTTGSSFTTIENMTRFGLIGACIKIPFITKQ